MRTILHRDGTVTYWSVYRQVWERRTTAIPSQEYAAMSALERERVQSHIYGPAVTRHCQNPIVSETEIRLFCGKPLTRVGVGQYVCRSCLARVAGSTTSDRKKASSAANGRKGGRPRKVQP